jgi:hypothetical protein
MTIYSILIGSGGKPTPTVPFYYVTALLSGDGTDSGTNNSFTDTSAISASITRNGTPTQGLFSPFSQPTGYWSNYFVNTSYVALPANSVNVAANDFSLEAWIYPLDRSNAYYIFGGQSDRTTLGGSSYNFLMPSSSGYLVCEIYIGGAAYPINSTTAVPLNAWSHVAFCRTGGTASLFLNGTQVATRSDLSTNAINTGSTANVPAIGANAAGSSTTFSGYISNLRFIIGSGGYNATSSTITVPTVPLTTTINTKLLSCQSNRFVDNSSNAFAATPSGTPQIQQFAPFTSSTAWSSTNGGSLYFDGTGDYLTNTTNTYQYIRGTGDWTFECFVYPFAYGGTTVGADLFAVTDVTSGSGGGLNNGFHINLGQDINNFRLISNASGTWADNITAGTGGGPPLYAWTHMATVREGDRISIFKNGTRVNTGTGFANYQFSPSAVNTAGNYSLAVQDGRALAATSASAAFGTGNFTAEFFVYRPNTDFASGFQLSTGNNDFGFEFRVGDNNCLIMHTSGANVFTLGTVPQNQWVHCALVRSSSNMSAWINGTRVYNNPSYTKDFSGGGNTYVIGGRSGGGSLIYNANMRLSSNVYYDPNSTTITPPYAGFGYSSGDRIIAGVSDVLLNNTGLTSLTVLLGSPYVWPWGPLTNSTYSKAANSVVGRFNDGGTIRDFNGYIAFPRFQQNAVYSASATTITVPTAALGNDGNTLQLLKGTNGQLVDSSLKNNWDTVGDARIRTAQSKFGGSSMYFDGTGDYLITNGGVNFAFGTGNFTVEFWVNISGNGVFYDSRPLSTDGLYVTIAASDFPAASGNSVSFVVSGARQITGTAVIKDSLWHHVALCRVSGITRLFVDGLQTGSSYTDANNYLNGANRPVIGSQGYTLATAVPTGYIDDMRITKGYGLYFESFTVPSVLPKT